MKKVIILAAIALTMTGCSGKEVKDLDNSGGQVDIVDGLSETSPYEIGEDGYVAIIPGKPMYKPENIEEYEYIKKISMEDNRVIYYDSLIDEFMYLEDKESGSELVYAESSYNYSKVKPQAIYEYEGDIFELMEEGIVQEANEEEEFDFITSTIFRSSLSKKEFSLRGDFKFKAEELNHNAESFVDFNSNGLIGNEDIIEIEMEEAKKLYFNQRTKEVLYIDDESIIRADMTILTGETSVEPREGEAVSYKYSDFSILAIDEFRYLEQKDSQGDPIIVVEPMMFFIDKSEYLYEIWEGDLHFLTDKVIK